MRVSAAEPLHPLAGIAAPGRHGAAGGTPLRISLPDREIVQVQCLRGHAAMVAQLMRDRFGVALPEAGRSTAGPGTTALWTQPGGWMLTAPRVAEGQLARAITAVLWDHASVADQSHGRVTIAIEGPMARDVLAKGCRLDLHPRVFGPGQVAATVIAHVNCLIHQTDAAPRFELTVASTLAEPFFHWLTQSAAGFGYEIA